MLVCLESCMLKEGEKKKMMKMGDKAYLAPDVILRMILTGDFSG